MLIAGTILSLTLLTTAGNTVKAAGFDWFSKAKDVVGGISNSLPGIGSKQVLPSKEEITLGLKEALTVGTGRVVEKLGQPDGFFRDPKIHIPLPDSFESVRQALRPVGMSGMLDDLELRLNRAAEQATPQAKELFLQAISEMTMEDAMQIYQGPNDACTRYFQSKMNEPLAKAMHPIIEEKLRMSGAVVAYNTVMGRYKALPFVPDVEADLSQHVVERGVGGIFEYLAKEEAMIRTDPASRTTDLLKKVFTSR